MLQLGGGGGHLQRENTTVNSKISLLSLTKFKVSIWPERIFNVLYLFPAEISIPENFFHSATFSQNIE